MLKFLDFIGTDKAAKFIEIEVFNIDTYFEECTRDLGSISGDFPDLLGSVSEGRFILSFIFILFLFYLYFIFLIYFFILLFFSYYMSLPLFSVLIIYFYLYFLFLFHVFIFTSSFVVLYFLSLKFLLPY